MKKIIKIILQSLLSAHTNVIIYHIMKNWKLFPYIVRLWIRFLKSPDSVLLGKKNTAVKLSFAEFYLLNLDGWYHDFEALGLKTGALHPNQRCKQQNIFTFIDQAVSICQKQVKEVCGIELFCANGYYSNYAVKKEAIKMYGIDNDYFYIAKARLITKILGNSDKIKFDCRDVFEFTETYDFCICAGGLYHISNPQELLRLLAARVRYALVIQTVYSLANESKNYFESPAPGWTWGCRFSYRYFIKMVNDAGWSIISEAVNQLEGNKRLEDRGSVYLLCVPEHTSKA